VPRLLAAGYAVRVFVRDPGKLIDVPWAKDVQIVAGDLGDASTLVPAVDGVSVLYYLVHSMAIPTTSTRGTPSTSGGSRSCVGGSFLRLRAEMKVPGQAWLELSVTPDRRGAGAVPEDGPRRRGVTSEPKVPSVSQPGLQSLCKWSSL